jgi:hypothetical protein
MPYIETGLPDSGDLPSPLPEGVLASDRSASKVRQVNEWNPDEREIAMTVNLMLQGRGNNTGELTLTPNSTVTVVKDNLFQTQQVPLMVPASASAAETPVYISRRSQGEFVVRHVANSATDRRFLYVRIG